ncbi:hypothetical protein BKA62DRAFT_757946 [Auriculariales sp. MPI-PUGE-AT-0066]|nr:hypothetical protein BKA62DRAFT_757946 [Auriculariales sp. MPI-PUGE-AT-0066]
MFHCFPTQADAQIFYANTVFGRGFNVPPDPFSNSGRAIIELQIKEWTAMSEARFKICEQAVDSQEIPFMGTPTVVRDYDFIVRALDGDDALINFYGLSYGSILGQYLVNMLPDRVGKVAIDGVVPAEMWSSTPPYKWSSSWLVKIEDTFNLMLKECGSVGPERCPLAKTKGEDYGAIEAVYALTNYPKSLDRFAPAFAGAIGGNYTLLSQQMLQPITFTSSPIPGDVSRALISCMDTVSYNPDQPKTWPSLKQVTDELLNTLRSVSPRFGISTLLAEQDGFCQFLHSTQKLPERYNGPWNAKLKTPVLILNNDLDPITSVVNARSVNQVMGSSARLVVNDNTPGHTTIISGPSICVARAVRDYFANNKPPAQKETHCVNDETIFNRIDITTAGRITNATDQDLVDAVYELRAVFYAINTGNLGLP